MVNEELELDQEESEVNEKRKREAVEPAIYNIYDAFRVVIDDSDTMTLEKKVKYTDGTEGWIFDGYFQDWNVMFKDVHKSLPKIMALRKGGGNIEDLFQVIKEAMGKVDEWFAPRLK